jgi:peptide/nickel transport system substrate-binding protein
VRNHRSVIVVNERDPGPLRGSFNRRDLLKFTSMGVAAAAMLGTTAACGSTDLSGGQAPSGPPKRGGTLTLGGSGGAASDTLDPHIGTTNCDYARLPLLYDPLVGLDHQGKVKYVLAESIVADATGKSYVITIRKGVVAHDGQPFTAEDVLFNFKRIVDC